MGVKPFYYHVSDSLLVFASEVKALLKIPQIPVKPNKNRIAHFLTYLFEDRKITFYEDILRLPAAYRLVVTGDEFSIKRYWKLNYKNKVLFDSQQEYNDQFLKIFTDSIECRLRSIYPRGALLSGGLDSSSIVCTVREILLKNKGDFLKTFSLVFDDTPQSESLSILIMF